MGQRRAVTNRLATKYKQATRPEKSEILDQLVELTRWHRDHARAELRRAGTVRVASPRKARPPVYSSRIVSALELVWRVARCPAGKRLAPMLVLVVPMLRRDGEIDLSDDEADLLVAMSAATIDRRLQGAKVLAGFTAVSHTKPGSLLKSQIPIRTWSEWDDDRPGFVEIDLVGHEGGNSFGEFCFTLTVTDIATGWTVNRSVVNKAAIHVVAALIIRRFAPDLVTVVTLVCAAVGVACSQGVHSTRPPMPWSKCGEMATESVLCTTIALTNDNVSGVSLRAGMVPAASRGNRPLLVLDPGGPGVSGIAFLALAIEKLPPAIRDRFNIVAFDRPGVGGSEAIRCTFSTDTLAEARIPPADLLDGASILDLCAFSDAPAGTMELLSTARLARTLERVRVNLGSHKISFLTNSYGSVLALAYADRYPERIARMVLDSPVDPSLPAAIKVRDQAEAFEKAFYHALAQCPRPCPLGDEPAAEVERVVAALPKESSEGDLTGGIVSATILDELGQGADSSYALWHAIRAIALGDEGAMRVLARHILGGTEAEHAAIYSGNLTRCVDLRTWNSNAEFDEAYTALRASHGFIGDYLARLSSLCGLGDVHDRRDFARVPSSAIPTLILVNDHDPVTPAKWARGLAERISGAKFEAFPEWQHGTFVSNWCAPQLAYSFLLETSPPRRCGS